jgi:hypothetical protein
MQQIFTFKNSAKTTQEITNAQTNWDSAFMTDNLDEYCKMKVLSLPLLDTERINMVFNDSSKIITNIVSDINSLHSTAAELAIILAKRCT